MKWLVGILLLVANLFIDVIAYAEDSANTAATDKTASSVEGSPVADQRAASIQADNLTRRRILQDVKKSGVIADETKKAIGVKVQGNTIFLQGPVNTVEEKEALVKIALTHGPKYKINDTTVVK